MDRPAINLLVCDLDNTLYDWVSYFVPSFYAMVDAAVPILQCDRNRLLDELKSVNQYYGDSEQPFALLETPTVRRRFADKALAARALDSAFHAFNSQRKGNLKTYPGVIETLQRIVDAGIRVVGHTESKFHAVIDRTRRLNLIGYFDRIYCRERSDIRHPFQTSLESWLKDFPVSRIVELSNHQRKPDPSVLGEIIARESGDRRHTVFVGDSIARDVLMAKRADVLSIWAAYGTSHNAKLYEDLVRVTHWTDDDVVREKRLRQEALSVRPDYTLQIGFFELIDVLGLANEPSSRAVSQEM